MCASAFIVNTNKNAFPTFTATTKTHSPLLLQPQNSFLAFLQQQKTHSPLLDLTSSITHSLKAPDNDAEQCFVAGAISVNAEFTGETSTRIGSDAHRVLSHVGMQQA